MTKNEALKLALEALERSMEAGLTGIKVDEAITVIRQALARPEQEPFEMKWPDYNESAMGCGIEDRNITDRYEAMQYGWDEAISRVSECLPDVLFTAPPSKQEPDYGIDRGAWSDVPDATKWVDELRGDEDLDAPPNSTTDVVEPVAWGFQNTAITGSNRWMYLRETIPTNDQYRGVLWTPLYTAPPKQEFVCSTGLCHYKHWVGLTDEEILEAAGIDGADTWVFETAYAIEAKLKEKNT